MKRNILFAFLLAATATAGAQDKALPWFRGCHQLTQYDSTTVFMEESGLSYVVNHKLINIMDRTGAKNNSVLKVDYDPQSAYVEIRQVLVHRNNEGGTDTLLLTDDKGNKLAGTAQVYDYVAPARLIYWSASQKMVEIGHLEPGDQIEYTTFRKGFTYALLGDDDSRYIPPMRGHFYDIVPFWSTQPILEKVYSVNVLTIKNLQYRVYNGELTESQKVEGDRTIYTFSKKDIAPLTSEPRMVAHNDVECKLLLSTSPNWEAKSMWFYGVNENYGSFKSTPEVTAKVRELLQSAKSEMDSISILTHWVADNMRYAGISMGEGEGFTLHNAQMNFTDRCGVCKDKAGMLITMLRAAGFKAYAAMTMAGERIDRIPADQFNHSVCAVQRRNGQFMMLDPTWVPNVRELWSSAEQQQGYLIGLPQGADLMETPVSPADKHYVRINATSSINKKGTLKGTISITAEGQSDKAVRSVMNSRTSEWSRNLELELLKISPRAIVKEVTHTDYDRYLDQPVTITYTYEIPDYAVIDGDNLMFIPLSARNFYRRAMSELNFDENVKTRNYPFSDQCSRLIEINETITLPAQYSKLTFGNGKTKAIQGVVHPAVNFGCGYQLEGNTLSFGESIMLNKRVYQAADWPPFCQAVKNQKSLATTPVVLSK
jgi:hypothetical protein